MFGAHCVSAFGLLAAFLLLLCSPFCNAVLNAQLLMVSDSYYLQKTGSIWATPSGWWSEHQTPKFSSATRSSAGLMPLTLGLHKKVGASTRSGNEPLRLRHPVRLGAPLSKDAKVLVPRTSGGNPPTFMSALYVSMGANHSSAQKAFYGMTSGTIWNELHKRCLVVLERLGSPKTNTLPPGELVSSMLTEPAAGSIFDIATATDFDAMPRVALLEMGVDMGFPMLGRIIAQRFKLLPGSPLVAE
ncbi:hypothetical protein B0T26DRAFT_681296 [Lasiosphaeria miniovina]|uniref:Uncharacterized protein n=1 Tax=Lasiosphaeria miniovina TaxID=1954250 RepID=A0AA39ZU60_9PEZI|nr:uncharacterized protein B0T26DRAFT_681296 [Lasiosphaeria miniovina]KAK0703643.1 hypothetical protein B0T26DRAFT_681296 [Lasiosphaeria miniovina]